MPSAPSTEPKGDAREAAPPKRSDEQVVNGLVTGCLLSAAAYFSLGAIAGEMHNLSQFPRDYPHFQMPLVFRFGTWTINLVPLAVVGGLYFLLRPRFPSFARGLGYCLLVIGVLLLWGLATCRR